MKRKNRYRKRLSGCAAAVLWSIFFTLSAQQRADTVTVYTIPEVVVTEYYQTREVRTANPTQIISREQLRSMNALQLSDAVKHFSGVTVKDYGGIGGLKTVSLRSLGATHTVVSYDGIALSNTQSGQVDIGKFSLENVDRISLINGQDEQIFQAARMFASAGVLNIQTLTPQFREGKQCNLRAAVKTGSWGFINPSLSFEQKLSDKWALAASGEWMSTDGRYSYIMHYGGANDSTSHEKRKNTEVRTLRAEAELFGNFSATEQWRTKFYFYQSSRGLPKATILYYDFATQHLWDKNVFAQTHYKKEFNAKWVFQSSAKWNWNFQHYLDPDDINSAGKTENHYYQQEYYLTASLLYRMMDHLSLALSTDGSIQNLNADLNAFVKPERYSWLSVLATKYVNERLSASASLLATVVNEKRRHGDAGRNHRRLSPAVSTSVKLLEREELRLRAFYKEIFRLPTFNDLYYPQIGDRNLIPEKTRQYNLGVTYSKRLSALLPHLSLTFDAYYNKVNDKIVAIPTKNIFVWSMVNLGKVDIKGVDTTASCTLEPCKDFHLLISANYTWQRALDVTDSSQKTYKHQIAYTPESSGSGQVALEMPWVNLSYTVLHAGERYALGQNIPLNRLESYTDHSVAVYRDFRVKKGSARVKFEVLNLSDKNYEVVRNFPMPGRSVRAAFELIF